MAKYEITIDPKVIAILGPHLYGDTASIIAELVSNCYDADADNCWVTLKTGTTPEIVIEDDGDGMNPADVNKYFLDIGYNRRDERPVTRKDRRVFGRKGIGKLAAFSLAKKIELYSQKDKQKAGCILDYDKITEEGNKNPDAIPDEAIVFEPEKLSKDGTGTRIVLKDIRRNINNTYYYLVNRIVRNFSVDFDKFKVHIAKNDQEPRTVRYVDLDYFGKMDTIVTIGSEYEEKGDLVRGNKIPEEYKKVFCYERDDQISKLFKIPRHARVFNQRGEEVEIEFTFKGWIGTIVDKGNLRGLIIDEGASEEEINSISINDNRITIFSRERIGEYDVLPKVQSDTIYDAYVIGEIHVDIFEEDGLVDMAISNRRGYEETDERYKELMQNLKSLVTFIVARKAEVMRRRRDDKENEESKKIKEDFIGKSRTMDILTKKLEEAEYKTVQEDFLQFMRAVQKAQSTRQILMSHDSENKEYGFFIMKIFELLGVDVNNTFIFTSHAPTAPPHGVDIYDYLKDCFRSDIYVIFLFSRHFYDSNVCIAEAGAAWATNRYHSNVVIDIRHGDIDKPINNAEQGFSIRDINKLNTGEVVKFAQRVYSHISPAIPSEEKIHGAIAQAVKEFQGRLNTDSFSPKRKYQGHPVCSETGCGNTMDLKKDGSGLHYECRTPRCNKRIDAKID